MKVVSKTEPFLHASLVGILTKEENDLLYNICEDSCLSRVDSIDDLSYFIIPEDKHLLDKYGLAWCKANGIVNNNVGVRLKSKYWDEFYTIQNKISERLSSSEFTNIFPKLVQDSTNKPFSWQSGLCITSDYKSHQLLPHTDDPYQLKKYGEENNIEVGCGHYKGVIFIANDELDYSNYGTRFYENRDRSSEFYEEPFIGGNACVFKAGPNSWHGTEFPNGLPNRRYTITIEYYDL